MQFKNVHFSQFIDWDSVRFGEQKRFAVHAQGFCNRLRKTLISLIERIDLQTQTQFQNIDRNLLGLGNEKNLHSHAKSQ
jgi:hypothetical protein